MLIFHRRKFFLCQPNKNKVQIGLKYTYYHNQHVKRNSFWNFNILDHDIEIFLNYFLGRAVFCSEKIQKVRALDFSWINLKILIHLQMVPLITNKFTLKNFNRGLQYILTIWFSTQFIQSFSWLQGSLNECNTKLDICSVSNSL